MKLALSAPDGENLLIKLEKNKKIVDKIEIKARQSQAERFLLEIDKILKKNNLKLDDIKEIKVNNTGQSFSALRLAVSIANALAYAKKIKITGEQGNNLKFSHGELVKPVYNKKPNITSPRI